MTECLRASDAGSGFEGLVSLFQGGVGHVRACFMYRLRVSPGFGFGGHLSAGEGQHYKDGTTGWMA